MKSFIKKLCSCFIAFVILIGVMPISKKELKANAYNYITYGIDVSNARGTINWDKVRNAGIDFAIIRAGYGNANAYPEQKDSCFDYNISNAKRVGIKCGVYWFCYATSIDAAYAEADSCYSVIKGISLDYPVFVDIEDEKNHVLLNAFGPSKEKITNMTLAFCNRLASYGIDVGVYANKNWFSNYIDKNEIINHGYDIWLAHYPIKGGTPDPTQYDNSSLCNMWQYSENGHVDGINGNVDLDVSYTNYGEAITDYSSKISISSQTIPTDNLKQGSYFGIYGTISSNLPIEKVWGGIYKQSTDDIVQYVEEFPGTRTYDLHGLFNDKLIFNKLVAGNYTYRIYAKDSQETYTLINSDFSVGTVIPSSMTISGETVPSGTLQPGKFFAIKGIISSSLNITKVWGGVYNRGGAATAQYAEATPNSTKYDLSTYFDSKIVFNGLAVGYYTYRIQAKDANGKEYTLINSDFQIGTPILKPNKSELFVSADTINKGESITFTATSDTATGYTLGVDKDGERIITKEMPNGELILTFDDIGSYSAYVTSYNSEGYCDISKIIITVSSFSEKVMGDVDDNGEFEVADIVLFQRWLLAKPDASLNNWKAADLCEDNKLDIFDLCLMRKRIIGG